MKVVREVVKLIMFTQLWGFPVLLARMFSPAYLWLLVVSFIGTVIMFSHFEDLEKPQSENPNSPEKLKE